MRFYAVSTGSYDDFREVFIHALCPEEAVHKFLKSEFMSYNEIGTVWDVEMKGSVLRTTTELCRVELVGPRGHLWIQHSYDPPDHYKDTCVLCGDSAGSMPIEDFLVADHKCKSCAALKQVKI